MTEILLAGNILFRHLVPYTKEDALQLIHRTALYAAVHVAPFAHLLCAVDIIVGHIHSPCICNCSVDDHYFPVVATEHMVDPGEANGVKFEYFYSGISQFLEMALFQRSVVGVVAEAVEQSPHFHTFFHLCL